MLIRQIRRWEEYHDKADNNKTTHPNILLHFLGYLVLIAFAPLLESVGLHRFGWPDGRLGRVFRLQESYIITVSLLDVLFGGCDEAKVADYRRWES